MPASAGRVHPEETLGPVQAQLFRPQMERHGGLAHIEGVGVDPAAVEQQRQDGQGVLRGIGAPAAVVGPDMAPIVDASLFGPGGKDKNIGAVGHHAGVVVVRAPAFRAFVEVIFYHDLP